MPDGNELLKQAHELHEAGRIDEALSAAQAAIEADPGLIEARTYLGTTLITRRLRFREGLETLDETGRLAPDDAGVAYSLGWCYEFVAYRLEKQAQKPYRDPLELYAKAAEELRRCIGLESEPGLREDAEDLLESIEARLE